MSPPKVSLSGKEPLKQEFDELPLDKGDDAEFPSIIIIETEHRARNFRQQLKRRQCKRIICGITLVITVAVASLLTLTIVNVLRRHHRSGWKCKTLNRMPTNVQVDSEKQLIRASHDHDDESQTSALEILHEYTRHLVAYKNVDNNTCYIDRLDETFQEGYTRWESYETQSKDSQALQVISHKIEVAVLLHIGDASIYDHCKNADSFWVKEVKVTEVVTEMDIVYV